MMGGEETKLVNGYLTNNNICQHDLFRFLACPAMHYSKGKTVHIVKQLLINFIEHHELHIVENDKIDFYISLIDNQKFNTFLIIFFPNFSRLIWATTVINEIALFLKLLSAAGNVTDSNFFLSFMAVYENLKFSIQLNVCSRKSKSKYIVRRLSQRCLCNKLKSFEKR